MSLEAARTTESDATLGLVGRFTIPIADPRPSASLSTLGAPPKREKRGAAIYTSPCNKTMSYVYQGRENTVGIPTY